MLIPRFVVGMFSVGLIVLDAGVASGQGYPNKPIRMITGSSTGAGGFASGFIAQGISGPLGQRVVVDSRGGAVIKEEIVAKAPPDGYTVLIGGSSFWLAPLMQKMPYDPVKDFAPISMVARVSSLLVVHPSLPVKSVKELIAYAKARPGELNNAIGGVGGASHLAGELFKSMAGVNIVAISYKTESQQLLDLVSGQTHLTITSPDQIAEQVKVGKLRALAVSSAEPSALFPDLPTLSASGLPGYESVLSIVMVAPAKTPEGIINRLSQEVVRLLKTTEAKERLLSAGLEAVGSSPEELAAKVKSEMAKWGKIITDAGIKAN